MPQPQASRHHQEGPSHAVRDDVAFGPLQLGLSHDEVRACCDEAASAEVPPTARATLATAVALVASSKAQPRSFSCSTAPKALAATARSGMALK